MLFDEGINVFPVTDVTFKLHFTDQIFNGKVKKNKKGFISILASVRRSIHPSKMHSSKILSEGVTRDMRGKLLNRDRVPPLGLVIIVTFQLESLVWPIHWYPKLKETLQLLLSWLCNSVPIYYLTPMQARVLLNWFTNVVIVVPLSRRLRQQIRF